MEESRITLYIPLGVKAEAELFPGFGKKQIFQAAIGAVSFVLVAVLIWLITANVSVTMITALSGIAGSVMMTARDQTNQSVVDQCTNLIRFAREQKHYPYRYNFEWDD